MEQGHGTTTQPFKRTGRSTLTVMENVHIRFKRKKQMSNSINPVRLLTQNRIQLSLGICAKSDLQKHAPHLVLTSVSSVGEFRVMFMLFMFFWSFARVMNCFHIKNKALSPEIKTSGALPLLLGHAPPKPPLAHIPAPAPENVGCAPRALTLSFAPRRH